MSVNEHRCGDILGFPTPQAPGHKRKYKFHLYLGLAHDGSGKHVFMFISSEGSKHCMRIVKDDWPDMQKEESYINCRELYAYSPGELTRVNPDPRDRLSDDALVRLLDHVEDSETLTPSDINVVVDALRGYFEG